MTHLMRLMKLHATGKFEVCLLRQERAALCSSRTHICLLADLVRYSSVRARCSARCQTAVASIPAKCRWTCRCCCTPAGGVVREAFHGSMQWAMWRSVTALVRDRPSVWSMHEVVASCSPLRNAPPACWRIAHEIEQRPGKVQRKSPTCPQTQTACRQGAWKGARKCHCCQGALPSSGKGDLWGAIPWQHAMSNEGVCLVRARGCNFM